MVTVFLESPYAGDVEVNVAYAEACMIHSIMLGEAPFASHLLYTRMLDDTNALDRAAGLACAKAWRERADKVVVYADRGISPGMVEGIKHAESLGKPIVQRRLPSFEIAEGALDSYAVEDLASRSPAEKMELVHKYRTLVGQECLSRFLAKCEHVRNHERHPK